MIPPLDSDTTTLASPTASATADPDTAVAVIGMAGRFPGARSVDAFADMLWSGREGIVRFNAQDADQRPMGAPINDHPDFVPAAAPLDDIDQFDAAAFGLSARDAVLLDPQHRLFLECAVDSLDDGALDPRRMDGTIGVFGGCGISSYLLHSLIPADIIHQADPLEVLMGCDKDFLATRVAYLLDLTGPAVTVQSACSTALLAVHMAVQSLLNGECDAALAGGVTVTTPQRLGYLYHPSGIRSPDGRCRPFDAQAAGTVFGSGCGVVLLRPLRDALDAGDPIRAVIRATAANNDGQNKVGFTAPSVTGQSAVLSEALAVSGLSPDEVGYIEGHGTATPMGDPIEVAAIREVYGGTGGTGAPGCLLGSVKSNVGHLDAASGIAGFIKTVLTLERGEVPPTLHFRTANPEMPLTDTRFRVAAHVEPWPQPGLRRAAVSSFGVGGTNVHAVLEQAPPKAEPMISSAIPRDTEQDSPGRHQGPVLLPLSASSPEALTATARAMAAVVPSLQLTDMAWTLQTGRRTRPVRAALVTCAATAAEHLNALHTGRRATDRLRTAFLFAGQGSQSPGMGRELAERFPAFRETLEDCLRGFKSTADLDLKPLLLDAAPDDKAAAEALRQTETAQAAIFSHALACARLWQDLGLAPEVLLGHSIGQWAAAVVAEVVTLPDAIALVARRGALMQAAPQGAMLSVPFSEAACRPLLGQDIDLAAVNGSTLCVLSGSRTTLDRIATTQPNAKWLRTSHAFHSRAMTNAATAFTDAVARIPLKPPVIPILSNRTGAPLSDTEAVDPTIWGAHVRETVAFHRGLTTLSTLADAAVECGPGDGLSGLAALAFAETGQHDALAVATAPSVGTASTTDDHSTLLTAVGRLWERGASIDWEALNAPLRGRRIRLPATAFDRSRHWPSPTEPPHALYAAPSPVSADPEPATEEKDLSPLERMCRLWATTLAVPTVDADQRFLDLGGTSVIAMQLVARCAADGIKVSAADVMAAQTPRALLTRIGPSALPSQSEAPPPDSTAPGESRHRVLTAAQTLALAEGENRPIYLHATVAVSPDCARDAGEALAGALDVLRLRVRTSWRGTEVSVLPSDPAPVPIVPATITSTVPPPDRSDVTLKEGLSGKLTIYAPSADGASPCTLEVALHPVAGDTATALAILEAWVHRCLDRDNPPWGPVDPLPPDRHAPVTEQLAPPYGPAGPVTSYHDTLTLPPDALSAWTACHQTNDGLVLAAAAVVAGGTPDATRIVLREPDQLRRAFSLPPLPPSPGLDDVILALKAATMPQGAPLPIAPRAGVGVLWLGDLSRFHAADAAALVAVCADAGVSGSPQTPVAPRTITALARHRERCLVSVAGTDPKRDPHRLLTRLLEIIRALPQTHPSDAHGLSPEAFTAANAPLADLRRLFGLDTADAA